MDPQTLTVDQSIDVSRVANLLEAHAPEKRSARRRNIEFILSFCNDPDALLDVVHQLNGNLDAIERDHTTHVEAYEHTRQIAISQLCTHFQVETNDLDELVLRAKKRRGKLVEDLKKTLSESGDNLGVLLEAFENQKEVLRANPEVNGRIASLEGDIVLQQEIDRFIEEVHNAEAAMRATDFIALVSIAAHHSGNIEDWLNDHIKQGSLQEGNLRIGSYELHEFLGSGGQGIVFEAVNRQLVKEVAMKLRRTRCEDVSMQQIDQLPADEKRRKVDFFRELCLTQALSQNGENSYVPRVEDIGTFPEADFGTMELLRGCDFDEVLKHNQPLDPQVALYLTREASIGLKKAHDLKVTHCDIKTANLFLRDDGTIVIIDWGLAVVNKGSPLLEKLKQQALGKGEDAVRLHTVSNVTTAEQRSQETWTLRGSLSYLPPEGFNAEVADEPRRDIYSLGCTLYKLIENKTPHEKPGQTLSYFDIKESVESGAPTIERDRVSAGLIRLYGKMTSLSADDRHCDLGEVIDEIDKIDPSLKYKKLVVDPATKKLSLELTEEGMKRRTAQIRFVIAATILLGVGIPAGIATVTHLSSDGKQNGTEVVDPSREDNHEEIDPKPKKPEIIKRSKGNIHVFVTPEKGAPVQYIEMEVNGKTERLFPGEGFVEDATPEGARILIFSLKGKQLNAIREANGLTRKNDLDGPFGNKSETFAIMTDADGNIVMAGGSHVGCFSYNEEGEPVYNRAPPQVPEDFSTTDINTIKLGIDQVMPSDWEDAEKYAPVSLTPKHWIPNRQFIYKIMFKLKGKKTNPQVTKAPSIEKNVQYASTNPKKERIKHQNRTVSGNQVAIRNAMHRSVRRRS